MNNCERCFGPRGHFTVEIPTRGEWKLCELCLESLARFLALWLNNEPTMAPR
jgi:hypothetical protein